MISESVQINYSIGYKVSIIVSFVVSLLIIYFLYKVPSENKILESSDFEQPVFIIRFFAKISSFLNLFIGNSFLFIRNTISVWIVIYIFVFSLLNIFGQNDFLHNIKYYWEQDTSNHTLNLRIVSFIMSITYIINLFKTQKQNTIRNSFVLNHNTIYVTICYYLWLLKICDINAFSFISDITSWSLLYFFGYWNTISAYITDDEPKVNEKLHIVLVFMFIALSISSFILGIYLNFAFILLFFEERYSNFQNFLDLIPIGVYFVSIFIFFITLRYHVPELVFLVNEDKNLIELWSDPKLLDRYFYGRENSLSKSSNEE